MKMSILINFGINAGILRYICPIEINDFHIFDET